MTMLNSAVIALFAVGACSSSASASATPSLPFARFAPVSAAAAMAHRLAQRLKQAPPQEPSSAEMHPSATAAQHTGAADIAALRASGTAVYAVAYSGRGCGRADAMSAVFDEPNSFLGPTGTCEEGVPLPVQYLCNATQVTKAVHTPLMFEDGVQAGTVACVVVCISFAKRPCCVGGWVGGWGG